MANLEVSLNSTALPMFRAEDFKELLNANESDNKTLDGSLYTDFIGLNRSWQIKWPRLTDTQYDAIRALYEYQFTNETYLTLEIPYYSIDTIAKLEISSKDIKWDGCYIYDFSVTIIEALSVS